jgi:hypothetical protein
MDPSEPDDKYWIGQCLSDRLMEDEPFHSPEEAPLLRRFRDFEQKLEFAKYLGEGVQGIVLSARLNSVQYAIKLVSSERAFNLSEISNTITVLPVSYSQGLTARSRRAASLYESI